MGSSPAGCAIKKRAMRPLFNGIFDQRDSKAVKKTRSVFRPGISSQSEAAQCGAQAARLDARNRVPPAYVMISAFADDICPRQMIYPAGMIYAARIRKPKIIIPRVNASIQRIDPPNTSFRRQGRSASPVALRRALLYNQIDKTAECMFRQIREGRNDTACSGYAESFGR